MHSTIIDSPLGNIKIECDDEHLLKITILHPEGERQSHPRGVRWSRGLKILKRATKQLKEYFSGRRKKFSLPISFNKLGGTRFETIVWMALQKIPYGKTLSYKDLAKIVRHPKACRAAGNANGKNPLSIVIPCHRVVASSGYIGGYSSGVWRKKRLLTLENP